MARDIEASTELDDEALAIILRRRPDLKGKSLEEVKAVLRQQNPEKIDRRRKYPPRQL
jgi:hypothetical protein